MIKTFGDKKVNIRKILPADVRNAKKFLKLVNELVREQAKISWNREFTLKEEKTFLAETLKANKAKTRLYLVAECDKEIAGVATLEIGKWRTNHVARFGICLGKTFRGIGLGTAIMREIIRLSKTQLKPAPKIIKLEVYANNAPAIALYKKMGFKIAAKIPRQIQYKGKLVSEFIMLKEI